MRRTARGFTLIELLVVIAIILILAAILFPVFAKVRSKAIQTTCASNLSQLGKACEMYQNAWGDILVPVGMPFGDPSHIWYSLLDPYLKQMGGVVFNNDNLGKIYRCPAAPEEEVTAFAYQRSYGLNHRSGYAMYLDDILDYEQDPAANKDKVRIVPAARVKYPSATVRIAESAWESQGGSAFAPDPTSGQLDRTFPGRHNETGNVLWMDGHVSSITPELYNKMDGQPDAAVWLRLGGPKPSSP